MFLESKNWKLFLCLYVGATACIAGVRPVLSSVEVTANKALKSLEIRYDLSDVDSELITVKFQVSSDGGDSYMLETNDAFGDVGTEVRPGTDKLIRWKYPSYIHDIEKYVVRLVADDEDKPDLLSLALAIKVSDIQSIMTDFVGPRNYLEMDGMTNIEEAQDYFRTVPGDSSNAGMTRLEFEIPGGTGANYVYKIRGTEEETQTLLIGGHYDTVEGSPAADDNTTGIAAILSCMKVLSDWNFGKTVHFVLFDQEETGLFGSRHWANHEIELYERPELMINVDMIGYYAKQPGTQYFPEELKGVFPKAFEDISEDDFAGDFLLITADERSGTYGERYQQVVSELLPDFQTVPITVPEYAMSSVFRSGDHASFWDANIPAIHLGDGANTRNPNYHGPEDVIETLDLDMLTKATQSLLLTIATFAEIENSSSVITQIKVEVQ